MECCHRMFLVSFVNSQNLRKLRQHMKLHSGEACYQCVQCNRNFSTLFNLQLHQRVHSNERPFLCSVCGKGFKQKSTLQSHQVS